MAAHGQLVMPHNQCTQGSKHIACAFSCACASAASLASPSGSAAPASATAAPALARGAALTSCMLSTKPHATTWLPPGQAAPRSWPNSFLLRPQMTATWREQRGRRRRQRRKRQQQAGNQQQLAGRPCAACSAAAHHCRQGCAPVPRPAAACPAPPLSPAAGPCPRRRRPAKWQARLAAGPARRTARAAAAAVHADVSSSAARRRIPSSPSLSPQTCTSWRRAAACRQPRRRVAPASCAAARPPAGAC